MNEKPFIIQGSAEQIARLIRERGMLEKHTLSGFPLPFALQPLHNARSKK